MPWFEPPHDKTNKVAMHTTKIQISLGIRPVWSEPSLCVQWVAYDPTFLRADSEDSDQTGRMPRLIRVFAGRTATLMVLSWGGSFVLFPLYRLCLLEMTELISLQIYSCQFANPSHRIYKTFILFYWHIVGGICYCSNSVNNCNSRSENIYVFRVSVSKTINRGRS